MFLSWWAIKLFTVQFDTSLVHKIFKGTSKLALITGLLHSTTKVWPFGISIHVPSDQYGLYNLAGGNSRVPNL